MKKTSKARYEDVERISGYGRIFIADEESSTVESFNANYDLERLDVNSPEPLFVDDEVIVCMGKYTPPQTAIALLRRVVSAIKSQKSGDRWKKP